MRCAFPPTLAEFLEKALRPQASPMYRRVCLVQKLDCFAGPNHANLLGMKGYGSFCPVAKASEILTERWTLLVLRELLLGSHHFNQLRRGIPQMSPTLLSKRLKTLERIGLVLRKAGGNGHWEYHPTLAAEELAPIIEAVGHWGQKWARSRLTPDELDAGRLMWNMRRAFNVASIPPGGLVIYMEIVDARPKHWWFVVKGQEADLCWDDPGFEVDISVYTSLLILVQIFIGDLPLSRARELGQIEMHGPKHLISGMSTWFPRSTYADDNPLPPR
jgi:DNA-binding HxlR family transcriptional regulator